MLPTTTIFTLFLLLAIHSHDVMYCLALIPLATTEDWDKDAECLSPYRVIIPIVAPDGTVCDEAFVSFSKDHFFIWSVTVPSYNQERSGVYDPTDVSTWSIGPSRYTKLDPGVTYRTSATYTTVDTEVRSVYTYYKAGSSKALHRASPLQPEAAAFHIAAKVKAGTVHNDGESIVQYGAETVRLRFV